MQKLIDINILLSIFSSKFKIKINYLLCLGRRFFIYLILSIMTQSQNGTQGWLWEWREAQSQQSQPILWMVDLWKHGKFPSYVRPDWSPFTYNENFPLIIKKIQDNFAEASMLSWDWRMINLKLLWENNWPKIFDIKEVKSSYLYIIKEDGTIRLSDPYLQYESPSLPYPFIIIEKNQKISYSNILIEENSDWLCKCYSPLQRTVVLLYKKWEEYIPVRFEWLDNQEERDLFRDINKKVSKDEMFLAWNKLMIWNERQIRFEILRSWWIEFSNVSGMSNGDYFVTIWKEEVRFSPSQENKREPAWKIINGKFMLITYSNWISDRLNEVVSIDSWVYLLDPQTLFTIGWIQYYEVYDIRRNYPYIEKSQKDKYKKLYTDGKKCYDFLTDENWCVQIYKYRWVECPIINNKNDWWINGYDKLYDKENKLVSVLFNTNWEQEVIYLIQKETKEKEDKQKRIEYTKLVFSPEQAKMPILFIDIDNWVIWLWSDWRDNTSRYQFYRINNNWTLSLAYSNNYEYLFRDWIVKINWDWVQYEVIRRPWTSSVFTPVIINWKEYIYVRNLNIPWVIPIYMSISFEWVRTNKTKIEEDYDIDEETFLPKQSFQFWHETIYLTKKWQVKIWDDCYDLVNEKWEIVKNPKDAEFKIRDSKFLLLSYSVKLRSSEESVIGYIPWSISKWKPELLNLSCLEMSSSNCIRKYGNVTRCQLWSSDSVDLICRSIYPKWNIIWAYIEMNWDWQLREEFFSRVDTPWEWDSLVWEPFICEDCMVSVVEVISKKYLKDENWKLYYRPNLDRNLVKVSLPSGIKLLSGRDVFDSYEIKFCTNSWIQLLEQDWNIVKALHEWYDDYYKLKDWAKECRINWAKHSLIQAWDTRNNRLVSFIKIDWKYELFKVWDYLVYVDENDKTFRLYAKNRTHVEVEIKSSTKWLPNLSLVNIGGQENQIWTIENTTENKKWWTIYDYKNREFSVCALYKSWKNIKAIRLEDHWYKASLDHSWILSIWWVVYDTDFLDKLYEQLRPKTESQVDKVTKKVVAQVGEKLDWE